MHTVSITAVVGLLAASGALAAPNPQREATVASKDGGRMVTLHLLQGACKSPYYKRPNMPISSGTLDAMVKNCIDKIDPQRQFSTSYVEQLRNNERMKNGLAVATGTPPLYPEGYQVAKASRRTLPGDLEFSAQGQFPAGSEPALAIPQTFGRQIEVDQLSPADAPSSSSQRLDGVPRRQLLRKVTDNSLDKLNPNTKGWLMATDSTRPGRGADEGDKGKKDRPNAPRIQPDTMDELS
ncbi:MAG: hypothetical protein M1823_001163 [Watsoniomyces obsoletus]|nr:MAG: hypothetical protein M1823_001163 [Watsoniomyces obsoletus]